MKQLLLALISVTILSGCSSTPKKDGSVSSEFLGGNLKITYTKSGEFESLSSISSVKVTSDLPSAKEEAVSIATVRARRQIAEFLNTEVNSERFVSTVTKTLQDSETASGTNSMTLNSKIANEVKETIRQRSNALLKGTFVESEVYDSNSKTITVVVKTGVKESGISNTVRKLMN
jgi:hypothetical protein